MQTTLPDVTLQATLHILALERRSRMTEMPNTMRRAAAAQAATRQKEGTQTTRPNAGPWRSLDALISATRQAAADVATTKQMERAQTTLPSAMLQAMLHVFALGRRPLMKSLPGANLTMLKWMKRAQTALPGTALQAT